MDIYTDGGCRGNPGPGAWAYFIIRDGQEISRSGFEEQTTNNRMELTAVISALEHTEKEFIPLKSTLRVYTDSLYVQKGISLWIAAWEKNGWKTAAKKSVKNKDLWLRLKLLSDSLKPQWLWVAGHAGDRYNEACDELVNLTIDKHTK